MFEISTNFIPVDYVSPPFPSLYLPVNSAAYNRAILYYASDVWRFTVFWTMTFFAAFHFCAAFWAFAVHRNITGFFWIVLFYLLFSGFQAFVSGCVVSLFIWAVYSAGTFGMTTWVPFAWGVIQILVQVITSYSMMSTLL